MIGIRITNVIPNSPVRRRTPRVPSNLEPIVDIESKRVRASVGGRHKKDWRLEKWSTRSL